MRLNYQLLGMGRGFGPTINFLALVGIGSSAKRYKRGRIKRIRRRDSADYYNKYCERKMSMSQRKKRIKPQQFSTKGELVDDQNERELTAEEDILKENPYKTPPSNITNKGQDPANEKG